MKIAVTGSNGFIGRYLCSYLTEHLFDVAKMTRESQTYDPQSHLTFTSSDAELVAQLKNTTQSMIHLAGRAHSNHSSDMDFRRDNLDLSQRIAKICVDAEIPRLIYISSIKVNGNTTQGRSAYAADEIPDPSDAYGKSKWDTELALQKITIGTKTELVIIRPPLVYKQHTDNKKGSRDGNKGNLQTLARWVNKGIPLPFAGIDNRRDLVSIENLCSLIALVVQHPAAANQIFLVSDGVLRSTREIVQLALPQGCLNAKFFPVPSWLFVFLKLFKPLQHKIESLTCNLEVDISKTKTLLEWKPKS